MLTVRLPFIAYLAVFMLGKGVIALFDLDSWIAVMELVTNQLRLLWQHLIGMHELHFHFALLSHQVNCTVTEMPCC